MKKLIKYIIENYETEGTVFVRPQLSVYGHTNDFEKSWLVAVFVANGEIVQVFDQRTLYAASKAIIARLDQLGFKKEK